MGSKVKNEDAEKCLRELLTAEGYKLQNDPKKQGENGVDILAKKGGETFHIEVIGYKSTTAARSKDFCEVFFKAVSRLEDSRLEEGATHCVIALPKQFETGLPQRVKNHYTAWKRIGNAFPELEIWLVWVEENKICKKRGWNDWL